MRPPTGWRERGGEVELKNRDIIHRAAAQRTGDAITKSILGKPFTSNLQECIDLSRTFRPGNFAGGMTRQQLWRDGYVIALFRHSPGYYTEKRNRVIAEEPPNLLLAVSNGHAFFSKEDGFSAGVWCAALTADILQTAYAMHERCGVFRTMTAQQELHARRQFHMAAAEVKRQTPILLAVRPVTMFKSERVAA